MTHTFDEIIRLDSERTQGLWEGGYHKPYINDAGANGVITKIGDTINWVFVSDDTYMRCQYEDLAYIAAMPDAVGLLKRYREGLLKARDALIDLGACDDVNCPYADCNRALSFVQQLLQEEQKG